MLAVVAHQDLGGLVKILRQLDLVGRIHYIPHAIGFISALRRALPAIARAPPRPPRPGAALSRSAATVTAIAAIGILRFASLPQFRAAIVAFFLFLWPPTPQAFLCVSSSLFS